MKRYLKLIRISGKIAVNIRELISPRKSTIHENTTSYEKKEIIR
jgi:hypothetical protein